MLKARVTLQNLKTLTYNFPKANAQLAKEFTEQLDQLHQSFYCRLPNEALIFLQESLRSTKKGEHANRNTDNYATLPPRKKFNQ